jgi:hypothetical protein
MDEAADIAARTQRFNEAARTYTPPSSIRHAKLAPFKDGIVQLRQKGGSLRLIRELLATVGVAVGTDTVARFIAEVNGDPTPHLTPKRPGRQRAAAPRTVQPRNAAVTPVAAPIPLSPSRLETPADPAPADTPTERSRVRGPRIADPRNL